MAEDNSAKIAQLDELLQNGVESTTNDGQTTKFRSVDDLLKVRNDLQSRDANSKGKKPRVSTIRLNGF